MTKENTQAEAALPTQEHRSLRNAFGQFATGVTVVTTRSQSGLPVGLTANSFASVSLEPPLVSWCVDKASNRFPEFKAAEFYSISVLTAAQEDLSNLFAMRSWDDDVFKEVSWFSGLNDVPQLPEVCARFHCKTHTIYEGGDHLIIVGEVLDYEYEPADPLVFFTGAYRFLSKS